VQEPVAATFQVFSTKEMVAYIFFPTIKLLCHSSYKKYKKYPL
jgi:hypothetical protein